MKKLISLLVSSLLASSLLVGVCFVLASLTCTPVWADSLPAAEVEQKSKALKSDAVLRAMQDELDRTMKDLKLPNHPLPYFGSYQVTDEEHLQVSASFGAVQNSHRYFARGSDVTLRVGDKTLDNTAGVSGGMFSLSGLSGAGTLVTDDNYDALRYGLWMQTDRAYKHAVESLESTKARLSNLKIEDRPDCFSDAKPVVLVEDCAKMDLNANGWQERVRKLSAVVKDYPQIESSHFNMNVRARTRRFINSEGTLTRTASTGYLISMSATAACKDGMNVHDSDFFSVENIDRLPGQDKMEEVARALCKRVCNMADARRAEKYEGPVLFEKQSASELAVSNIPSLICAKKEALSAGADEDQVLGKPVLNAAISVADDATAKVFNGLPLKGGWIVDYEGVPAAKLTLVENGILKTLCSTRTPSRAVQISNGHCRGGAPSPGHLFLSTTEKNTVADLRTKLIAMGKEQHLPAVVIVRRSVPSFLSRHSTGSIGAILAMFSSASGSSPSLVYLVDVNTGKEELIRGARFKAMPKRGLLDWQLASDDAASYIVSMPSDSSATSISLVTPSILVKELEISKPTHTTELPPYLKNPYFESHSK
jgi:TldD protein